jgi:hypothetical protein
MPDYRTLGVTADGSRRDYRGVVIKPELAQHILGERIGEVRHACPECGVTPTPSPFCQVCLGVGHVSTERLDRYVYDLHVQSAKG